ncbi:MAG: HAD family hydrolase [Gammaproteobacteria bacterium]|nr:HAD family hydrolase [Gammaproteobacteria bacterium]
MQKIKLISFDLDDTLWDGKKVIKQAQNSMFDWLQLNHPQISNKTSPETYSACRQAVLLNYPEKKHDLTFLRKEVLKNIFIVNKYTPSTAHEHAESAFAAFYKARNSIQFFNNVESSLNQLKKQFTLAALTNGNADPVMTGLHHYMDYFFSAESVGQAKPHPEMYIQLLKQSGMKAEQCIHIGDHPQLDIISASKVGMKTIWFNPDKKKWPEKIRPNKEFSCFLQLPEIIEKLTN